MTNHYLQLVKSSQSFSASSCHPTKYPIIADSGANFQMFKDQEFFEQTTPANGHVFLGDGKTKVLIKGAGTIKCKIGENTFTVEGVCYVPDLA